ncbi:hypothetical protein NMY22_g13110 [Coprinellus aureogranulatus]|nr:hypothetical protein NMY22_g13110 [Coprinellus aureogranulatus]
MALPSSPASAPTPLPVYNPDTFPPRTVEENAYLLTFKEHLRKQAPYADGWSGRWHDVYGESFRQFPMTLTASPDLLLASRSHYGFFFPSILATDKFLASASDELTKVDGELHEYFRGVALAMFNGSEIPRVSDLAGRVHVVLGITSWFLEDIRAGLPVAPDRPPDSKNILHFSTQPSLHDYDGDWSKMVHRDTFEVLYPKICNLVKLEMRKYLKAVFTVMLQGPAGYVMRRVFPELNDAVTVRRFRHIANQMLVHDLVAHHYAIIPSIPARPELVRRVATFKASTGGTSTVSFGESPLSWPDSPELKAACGQQKTVAQTLVLKHSITKGTGYPIQGQGRKEMRVQARTFCGDAVFSTMGIAYALADDMQPGVHDVSNRAYSYVHPERVWRDGLQPIIAATALVMVTFEAAAEQGCFGRVDPEALAHDDDRMEKWFEKVKANVDSMLQLPCLEWELADLRRYTGLFLALHSTSDRALEYFYEQSLPEECRTAKGKDLFEKSNPFLPQAADQPQASLGIGIWETCQTSIAKHQRALNQIREMYDPQRRLPFPVRTTF